MIRKFVKPDEAVHLERITDNVSFARHEYVEPLPIGTYVIRVFRIVEFVQDADGSAMVNLESVDRHGDHTGWYPGNMGVYEDSTLVVDNPQDLWDIAEEA